MKITERKKNNTSQSKTEKINLREKKQRPFLFRFVIIEEMRLVKCLGGGIKQQFV